MGICRENAPVSQRLCEKKLQKVWKVAKNIVLLQCQFKNMILDIREKNKII